ncbi:MAG: spore germination protein [Bacillota bacterium]
MKFPGFFFPRPGKAKKIPAGRQEGLRQAEAGSPPETGGGGEAGVPSAAGISTPVKTPAWKDLLLSSSLDENLQNLQAVFANCSDIIFREFNFAQNQNIRLALIYTDGLVDKDLVSDQIMKALSLEVPLVASAKEITRADALEFILRQGLCIHQVDRTDRLERTVNAILSGDTVLLVDGHATAVINGARSWEARSVEDSITDKVVRGPREAFVETLRTNTSLLRRRIKNPALKIETLTLGRVTQTEVAVAYVAGIVQPGLVAEIKERLQRINIDGILEGGQIEELIEDNPLSPFGSVNHTDRVDKVAAQLLEGRAAVMVDGTPYVLTAPALFMEIIQDPEDYYQRYVFSALARLTRLISVITVLLASALYVAIITYNPELLPTPLLLSLAAQREGVPFPAFVEVLLMEFVFEALREAGLRMPQPLGQAVSIVGALVLGEAAVRAGLVGAATVIVVALTGVASFSFIYTGSITLRVIRFPLIFLAGFMGLYGLLIGVFALVVHLVSLRSFGIPFLSPVAPVVLSDQKDFVVRAPWWAMRSRPRLIARANPQREGPGAKPRPPAGRKKAGR